MKTQIKKITEEFLQEIETKPVRIISHLDTDGITAAAIIAQTLKRLDKKFSIKIVKSLDPEILGQELKRSEKETLLFTDLGSGSIEEIGKCPGKKIFILDHHEIEKEKLCPNINIANPHLTNSDDVCGAAIAYLFSKEISPKNTDLAKLAIIGMIGDRHEGEISKTYQEILNDTEELEIKKTLLIFSATRPLRKSLEYSTSFYIPGVTGSYEGVLELLRENNISPKSTLYELSEEDSSKLITSILIKRAAHQDPESIIGNIYITNFFNRKEDIREISTLINACSRLGESDIALSFCLGSEKAKNKAQEIYVKYKQELISGLRVAEKIEKEKGDGFVIINAQEKIKDTIIGTICSMLSSSPAYKQGTILIGMAYNQDKIKVSARIAGQATKNLREVLEKTVMDFEAEIGGHQAAAGCLINKQDEARFISSLKKTLEVEVVKL